MSGDDQPRPDLILETLNAYQRSEALKAGIALGLFSAVAGKRCTPSDLAERCGASERGLRMLCDYLVVIGMLTKNDEGYGPSPESARFLDHRSPHYLGGAVAFLGSGFLREAFATLPEAVRRGGTAVSGAGALRPNHEVWVEFARGMAPVMAPTAESLSAWIDERGHNPRRVLDVAAGHGLFGIAVARRNPGAHVVAVDWPNVLEVARAHARSAGIADRYRVVPGDVRHVAFGDDYDLALVTNLLHHFDRATCVSVLDRLHAALRPGGRLVILEYVPNEDRVSPPRAASFALVMLATTPEGDAYTFAEYEAMLRQTGFVDSRLADLPGSLHQVIEAARELRRGAGRATTEP